MDPTNTFQPELLISPTPNAPYVQLGITKNGLAPLVRCPSASVANPHKIKFHMQVMKTCEKCGVHEKLELGNPKPPFSTTIPVDQGMIPLGFISSESQCFACHGYIAPEVTPLITTNGLCQQCSVLVNIIRWLIAYKAFRKFPFPKGLSQKSFFRSGTYQIFRYSN